MSVKEIAGNAAAGAAFQELFSGSRQAITHVAKRTIHFQSYLKGLDKTLSKLEKLFKNIPPDESSVKESVKLVDKGRKLVRECKNLQWWKQSIRFVYADKLRKMDKELLAFIQSSSMARIMKDMSETKNLVTEISKRVNATESSIDQGEGEGSSYSRTSSIRSDSLKNRNFELKMHLLKKELNMLAVTAPPGCGKTTLVKMPCHDEQIKGIVLPQIFFFCIYKDILFVPISRNPNLQVIVEKLFRREATNQVPEFVSDEDAINQLEQLLNQINGHVLLILDDARSRSESLLDNPEDAMKLFRHSANLKENRSQITEKVINCEKLWGGFPLALEVVRRSLRGRSDSIWHSRGMKWSSGPITDSEEEHLLVSLGQSLDFKDNDIIHKCPDVRAIKALDDIAIWNLVSLLAIRKDASGVGRYSSEDFVLQHDVLRELAIHQSSQKPIEQRERLIVDITENNLPKWWVEQRQQLPLSAQSLSISIDEKFLSMWSEILPLKVKVLVLNFRTKNYTLPEFEMDRLKVLIVTNYGFSSAELGNFQLLGSVPNLKRIRLATVSIPSLSKTPVELKSLKKISLFMCHIGQAFKNCSIQISDAMPNLTDINIDYCNDLVELPVGLCDIVSLKKFSLSNCHNLSALPEGMGKLKNLDVLMLRSCTALSELPQSITSLHNLNLLDISDCLSIIKLPEHIGELRNLKEFHVKGCLRLHDMPLPPSIMDLKELELVTCDEVIKAKFWELNKQEFPTNLEIKVPERDINLNFLL
ncbi:hypothetical protein I3842_01G022100 [Carya illinoinensis]|uniref:RPW8 domain-containing protein n=1 Tax=Carya illinoinensis TaxID=32201 RepID=A0A922K2Z7_CARIL|nr:hypothetical protein I3842_01G022100 [Carya illinoinensis]